VGEAPGTTRDYCTFAGVMCEDAKTTRADTGQTALLRSDLVRLMPRKRKKKKIFSAAKAVREMARERVGSPRASRLVAGRKAKAEKYKPTLGKLLEDQ
jgi:hypothetical protein